MKLLYILHFLLMGLLLGCAQDFKTKNSEGTNCIANCIENIDDKMPNLSLGEKLGIEESLVNTSYAPNFKVIDIDELNYALVYRIPIPVALGIPGIQFPIHEIPGAYAKVDQDQNATWYLLVSIPLQAYLPGTSGGDPHHLPNGDLLPAIPGGELPSLGVVVHNHGKPIYLYIGPQIMAAFIPTPGFDPTLQLSFPIKNRSSTKILGYIVSVPEKNNHDGGIYMAYDLPDGLSQVIDELL